LRGLVATRQVHTISLGHAPHFYVAGTLPEFATPPTIYASASMPASAYFMRSDDHDEELPEPVVAKQSLPAAPGPGCAAQSQAESTRPHRCRRASRWRAEIRRCPAPLQPSGSLIPAIASRRNRPPAAVRSGVRR
jgi:hypothetical protein